MAEFCLEGTYKITEIHWHQKCSFRVFSILRCQFSHTVTWAFALSPQTVFENNPCLFLNFCSKPLLAVNLECPTGKAYSRAFSKISDSESGKFLSLILLIHLSIAFPKSLYLHVLFHFYARPWSDLFWLLIFYNYRQSACRSIKLFGHILLIQSLIDLFQNVHFTRESYALCRSYFLQVQ